MKHWVYGQFDEDWVKDMMRRAAQDGVFDRMWAAMAQDIVVEREGVERKWEWRHAPTEQACDRKDKPVYTPVNDRPSPCRECGTDDWDSGGIVLRGKDTKNVVYREKK